MVDTNVGFRLCAYLRSISCRLTFADGKEVELTEVAVTEEIQCEYKLNTMVHGFCASAVIDTATIRDTVAKLRLDYHISFTGNPSEGPQCFETVVPVFVRRTVYGGS